VGVSTGGYGGTAPDETNDPEYRVQKLEIMSSAVLLRPTQLKDNERAALRLRRRRRSLHKKWK
jgi:hypothetical protein